MKIYQNLWNAAKAVFKVNTYIKREERSQINDLSLPIKQLEKEEQINPKYTEGRSKQNSMKQKTGKNRENQ